MKKIFLDFDGTLAPIRRNPEKVRLSLATKKILANLTSKLKAKVYVISGRPLAFLKKAVQNPKITLIAEHGLKKAGKKRIAKLKKAFQTLANPFQGAIIEAKNTGVTFHYRKVKPALHEKANTQAILLADALGAKVIPGKKVVEAVFSQEGKGKAITDNATKHDTIIAIGDDYTDESMFEAVNKLGGRTIKIGVGLTNAKETITSIRQARLILAKINDS